MFGICESKQPFKNASEAQQITCVCHRIPFIWKLSVNALKHWHSGECQEFSTTNVIHISTNLCCTYQPIKYNVLGYGSKPYALLRLPKYAPYVVDDR